MKPEENVITPEMLAKNNGQNGNPTYLLHEGKVYDVSSSQLWKSGKHMNQHQAGGDLTSEIAAAPHKPDVLDRFPLVGVMAPQGVGGKPGPGQEVREPQGEDTKRGPQAEVKTAKDDSLKSGPDLPDIVRRYPFLQRHPHPMTVHFPIVFSFAAPLFSLLYLVFGWKGFDMTALSCLGAGAAFTPVAMTTGYFTWKFNYMARWIRPVTIKIACSSLLLLDLIACFVWRLRVPGILEPGAPDRGLYLALLLLMIPLASVIGGFGAMLTFPLREGEGPTT